MSEYKIRNFTPGEVAESFSNRHISKEEVAERSKIKYLFEYLKNLETKTLIVEKKYVDGNYLEDYSEYYSRCFENYSRMCKRIHFFSCNIDDEILEGFITGEIKNAEEKSLRASYCGFAVARPLPERVIGRTALRTYPSDGGRRKYQAVVDVNANLFGADLTVTTLPFQEQDNVVAACATVALWSALHKTAELFNSRAPRPAAITNTANQVVELQRPVPTGGLKLRQVAHAVRSVGLTPEVIDVQEGTPLISLMCSYLQFGLPIILAAKVGEELHAVTVNGFSKVEDRQHSREVANSASSARLPDMEGLWVDAFYAHDDGIGPFSRLDIVSGTTEYPVKFEGGWDDPLSPRALIIPIYDKMRVTFLDIQEWLMRLDTVVQAIDPTQDKSIRWNVRITTVNEFKRNLRSNASLKRKVGINCAKRLLKKSQPRFIWRVEAAHKDTSLFEILADSTDMGTSLPAYEFIPYNSDFVTQLRRVINADTGRATLRNTLGTSLLNFLKEEV